MDLWLARAILWVFLKNCRVLTGSHHSNSALVPLTERNWTGFGRIIQTYKHDMKLHQISVHFLLIKIRYCAWLYPPSPSLEQVGNIDGEQHWAKAGSLWYSSSQLFLFWKGS